MKIKRGSTSVRRYIFIGDSSSTAGAGLTGLVYNSSGLVAYYIAGDLSNEVQITLASATLGSFTSGGFVEVDATNMPGWYEVGIPNAALDSGNEVAIQFRGATNMVPTNLYIELDAFDYQTATQPVNVTQITGDTVPASNLAKSASAICTGTVTTGASTTSIPTSALSPAGSVADQFKGRIIIFTRDTTTAALRGQATEITASSASATPTFTVTALTTTPSSGDTFVIV